MNKVDLCKLYICASVLLIGSHVAAQTIAVSSSGELLRDGKPYRAVGVNYVDAFWRVMENPSDISYDQGFADLAAEEIPFARIAATPFWPLKLREYQADRDTYLQRLDSVVKSAETHGIGLIMSLFWADFTVPDVVGEPRNQWGNPDSKTIVFMREYTKTLVTRYLDSPAVWIWEFGNEYNLAVDLPNASTHRPPIVPKLGTPESRTEADEISTPHILVAFTEFAKVVRAIDTQRPITSGNSMPRAFAERIRQSKKWVPIDTPTEFQYNLALVNPGNLNLLSVHLYPDHRMENRFKKDTNASYFDLLTAAKEAGVREGKPLFLGEFGASLRTLKSDREVRIEFDQLLNAIEKSGVDLAAVWNFDFANKQSEGQVLYTITRDNPRGYMLDRIRDANNRLRQE